MSGHFIRATFKFACVAVIAICLLSTARPLLAQRGGGTGAGVYKARITPHWYEGNMKFWYQNDLADGKREFVIVDAERGMREQVSEAPNDAAASTAASLPADAQRPGGGRGGRGSRDRSPDEKWIASIKDHNLVLRSTENDAEV